MSGRGRLDGRRVVVTGAGRGIGRAIARACAAEGAAVGVTWVSQPAAAAAVVEEIRAAGGTAAAAALDVRDRASVRAGLETLAGALGGIDVLVNNAGVNKPTDFDRITDADWDEVLAVNLRGPFVVTQEALRWLRAGGAVVNVGSVSGQYGGPRTAHYAASKGGLIALTQCMARFLAPRGVRANCVSPGLVASEMAAAGLAGLPPTIRDAILLGRLGEPDEVARAVVFLASEESAYCTGQTLNVNGGLHF
ncbi:MAG TPA: 3-oxoacyl-ACP reductase FabG [Candidatus Binatia bacterium]|jgi:3-oxoacyl-[acyl-carrier protein] reductase|nr:3-oxoacyl-ACP reductase FabG [Candidatus Binatia bacterium]